VAKAFAWGAGMSICVVPEDNAGEGRGPWPRIGLVPAFRRDERGVTAVVFALALSLIMMVVAVTIDYGMGYAERLRQQAAIDAATLAASHRLGLPDEQDAGPKVGEAFYVANTRPESHGTAVVTLDGEAGTVNGTASSSIATWFLNAVKGSATERLSIGTGSRVVKGKSSIELALVLDNSTSMMGDIGSLKTAANNLVGVVFAGAEGTDKVRVGVVPFAASVNVGSHYKTAYWIDADGNSSLHYQNFSENKTRFELLEAMGASWGGCVEARPAPYDTNDTPPSASNGDSLFVPMFAPDEPDDNNSGGSYSSVPYCNSLDPACYVNNYLVDDGGACTPQPRPCTRYRNGRCTSWGNPTPLDPAVAQARTCKYEGQARSGGLGPNQSCTTTALLPLTSTRATVESAINGMQVGSWTNIGYTNIGEGTMWGWRLVSPEEPFTEGRAYDDAGNSKYLVVMTDGENTYTPRSHHNQSTYSAFGYVSKGRLGSYGSTPTASALRSQMDTKLRSACANAKAAGITVFTVGFRLDDDPTSLALLTECASGSDRALQANDGEALVRAFEQIGREISQVRVAG
jgi:Flp pilus assembly protein TadG